ncbi:MAG TPA: anti-sigma factor [Hyphomicrobiaceae bacterium]|jgi:anti-sigma-K factor RskA|nr:anti-sigma factor [Hyphomicrobiaceae bacterium]
MNDREDIDGLAAEYVLGTLDASERTAVAARRQREHDLDAAIGAWERRLAPLADAVAPLEPPRGLFARIEARLSDAGGAGQIVELQQRVKRWRNLAAAASAVAACLLVVMGVREMVRPQAPSSYVAVFQKDDVSPAFLLAVDLQTRTLSIRMVAAERQPGKSYQLWIATEQSGGVPQSLGLIEDRADITRTVLTSYDPAVVQTATFGVSLEPAGGSPTGRPTGPALHAKLIPSPK